MQPDFLDEMIAERTARDPLFPSLLRLAEGRRRRMASGRPVFDLTAEDHERSTRTAMRIARGGKS